MPVQLIGSRSCQLALSLALLLSLLGCAAQPDAAPSAATPAIDPATTPVPYVLKPDAPDDVRDYWQRCQDEKRKQIIETQREIREKQSDIERWRRADRAAGSSSPSYFRTSDESALARLQDSLRRLTNPDEIVEPRMLGLYGIGYLEVKVVQVVNDDEAIGRVESRLSSGPDLVWISGRYMKAYVDGDALPGVYRVTGRKQYNSVLGQRTVTAIEAFRIRDHLLKR